ncbi:MAG: aminotransferase class I/II-fold pyridoxal phosphate-dependent enzyme [Zetaproteobacteria bacterium]|nr:aminotransferase class I/II-fold pyridoxal phosphate-dependent enzyme [Zetaproteobacteria bacterium]
MSTPKSQPRLKRRAVKDNCSLYLKIVTTSGNEIKFDVLDCSIKAIGTKTARKNITDPLEIDSLITEGFLHDQENKIEIQPGRLVVSRLEERGDYFYVAFVFVDTHVPIDGVLSHYLVTDFDNNKSDYERDMNPDKFNISHFISAESKNIDLFHRANDFAVYYEAWAKMDKFAYFKPRKSSKGARVTIAHEGQSQNFVMMGSNDYLGLASHPDVLQAAKQAIDTYGLGATGTPPTSGYNQLQQQLETRLANLYGREAAVVFPSGFLTNSATIPSLCREGDLIIADQISHASMFSGIETSRAKSMIFRHNNMEHLESILSQHRADYNGCLILTEGAFSMDGDVGDLPSIQSLSRKYAARTYVDMGHCIGVLGETGLGAGEHFGLKSQIDISMGLFSKALGVVGGFIASDRAVCDWVKVIGKGYLFATALPPANCAAILASIDLMMKGGLREELQHKISYFRDGLIKIGAKISKDHCTPIIPVVVGDRDKINIIYTHLYQNGIFALPVVYPAVSTKLSRIRFSVRVDHSLGDLDFVLKTFAEALQRANFSFES